ncbi:MAG: hypothetical protein AAGD09_03135, partial [Cyanobacteria bacterium P01_F01_bin.56]
NDTTNASASIGNFRLKPHGTNFSAIMSKSKRTRVSRVVENFISKVLRFWALLMLGMNCIVTPTDDEPSIAKRGQDARGL